MRSSLFSEESMGAELWAVNEIYPRENESRTPKKRWTRGRRREEVEAESEVFMGAVKGKIANAASKTAWNSENGAEQQTEPEATTAPVVNVDRNSLPS
jgi:hypothetical protein